MNWSNRTGKQLAREFVMSNIHAPAKQAIMMPADTGLCCWTGLELGALTIESEIDTVDKFAKIADQGRKSLLAMGFNHVTQEACRLENCMIAPDACYDLAFFDLCGWLTPAIYKWLDDKFIPHLNHPATLAFTIGCTNGGHGAPDSSEQINVVSAILINHNRSFTCDQFPYRDSLIPMLAIKFNIY